MLLEGFLVYIITINVISAIICIYDKLMAKWGKRRISEHFLFTLCFLGGSPFMYITMRLIRHKTLHKRFMLGIPLIILVQIAIVLLVVSFLKY